MDIKQFLEKAQEYISAKIYNSSFNLQDFSQIGVIKEPYQIDDRSYQIYYLKKLTGFRPNKERPEPFLYAFFIVRPLGGEKEKFLAELKKKQDGQECDESIISHYYRPFFPAYEPFRILYENLAGMLSHDFLPGRGYEFIFQIAVPTKDYDIAIVFAEVGSLTKLKGIYPNEMPFNPAD